MTEQDALCIIQNLYYLSYLPIVLSIIISSIKILILLIYKLQKKSKPISSYGFVMSWILQVFHYVYLYRIDKWLIISVIILYVCLMIYAFSSVYYDDMPELPFICCGISYTILSLSFKEYDIYFWFFFVIGASIVIELPFVHHAFIDNSPNK